MKHLYFALYPLLLFVLVACGDPEPSPENTPQVTAETTTEQRRENPLAPVDESTDLPDAEDDDGIPDSVIAEVEA